MKVSIIIPCFNYGRFLPACLGSVMAQTYPNWEALILDDGSTDDTPSIAKSLAKQDPRIRYFRLQPGGVSKARNQGIQLSSGELIQFLDADDLISEEKLEIQVEEFRGDASLDITYTENFYFPDGDPARRFLDQEFRNRDWMHRFEGSGKDVIAHLIQNNLAVISSPILKKSLLGRSGTFPEDVAHTEDWQFWLQAAFAKAKVKYIPHPEAYTLIRVHTRSVSQNVSKMQYGELALRTWIRQQVQRSTWLSAKELNSLNQLNENRKALLVKHIMYLGPIGSWEHLIEMSKLIPWYQVAWFYLKTLNYRRKSIPLNPWKLSTSLSSPTQKIQP